MWNGEVKQWETERRHLKYLFMLCFSCKDITQVVFWIRPVIPRSVSLYIYFFFTIDKESMQNFTLLEPKVISLSIFVIFIIDPFTQTRMLLLVPYDFKWEGFCVFLTDTIRPNGILTIIHFACYLSWKRSFSGNPNVKFH